MGKRKLVIKRLETLKERHAKFSKRKKGILNKAKEFSVICDIDLALVMFSPSDKPVTYFAHDKDLGYFVEKMEKTSARDLEERRESTNKLLKKIFQKNVEAEVDVRSFSADGDDTVKVQEAQLEEMKNRLDERRKALEDFKNPRNVQDLNQIKSMKEHLITSLERIQKKKNRLLGKYQMERVINASSGPGAVNLAHGTFGDKN
ncbi:agamous-like MADS-box protein AGL30 [Carica papaya]|uniref:agamous-like MADS-box protein AGL30 n=1 Tax=Carica papaya TaxID=3649 RepID=UPI000B8CDE37|nr:agamous-like MADS-box protein AGL30 [Carica papaya]